MPEDEQGDPFGLIDSLFQDWFRDSLAGKQPPATFRGCALSLRRGPVTPASYRPLGQSDDVLMGVPRSWERSRFAKSTA
ncbi:MAG TPA: hypothetical protein VF223_17195 [Trebonia sp.]